MNKFQQALKGHHLKQTEELENLLQEKRTYLERKFEARLLTAIQNSKSPSNIVLSFVTSRNLTYREDITNLIKNYVVTNLPEGFSIVRSDEQYVYFHNVPYPNIIFTIKGTI